MPSTGCPRDGRRPAGLSGAGERPVLRAARARPAGSSPRRGRCRAEVLRRVPGLDGRRLGARTRRGMGPPADEEDRVSLADFHTRFGVGMFEGWRDVPGDVAARLNEWELAAYQDDLAADLKIGPDGGIGADPGSSRDAAYSYILLGEAEAPWWSATRYEWPCDCPRDVRALPQTGQRLPAFRQRPRARLGGIGRTRRLAAARGRSAG